MNGRGTQTSFLGDPPAAAQQSDLRDRRELALVAVERARMPMMVSDPRQPDNPIVLANQAFLDLTGYKADEIVGHNCRFLQGPETAPEDLARLRAALERGDDHIDVELLNYRKDGSTFWNQLCISAVRASDGQLLYHFGSQKDVSARRHAEALEAKEHRLLLEIDHRAMNALMLVQSFVSLSRAETVEALSLAINNRVSSIARAHRLLATRHWQGVDLLQLIETQTMIWPNGGLRTDGPPVAVGPQIVQPLSLVLHEMISNAVRHGALSYGTGEVDLSWQIDGGDLRLRWRERGPTLDGATLEERVGLEIARNVVERQLDGTMAIGINGGELEASFLFPNSIEP